MKVTFKNGHAIIKDFCPLGVGRSHDKKIMEGASSGESGGMVYVNVIDADMILVLGMLEELTIDGKKIETLDEETLEERLDYPAFDKIKAKCEELKGEKKVKKKT